MSGDIIKELYFLLHSFLLGIFITFIYDVLRIFRRIVKHGVWWVAAEDLVFWTASCIMIFLMFYKENDGILRGFAVIGALLGMLLYTATLGRLFVKYISKFILILIEWVKKILYMLLRPLALVLKQGKNIGSKTGRKAGSILKYWKKRLTKRLKMIKIILCKR